MANAFTSDECNLLAEALNFAWDICRNAGDLDTRNRDAAEAVLTQSILAGYETGERNARSLAIMAVAELDKPSTRRPEGGDRAIPAA